MEKLREVIKFFLIVWVQTLAWMSFSTQIMIAVELKMTIMTLLQCVVRKYRHVL